MRLFIGKSYIFKSIGENTNSKTNNLMPFIIQPSVGKCACLSFFSNNYDIDDGIGIGYSVKNIVKDFEIALEKEVPFNMLLKHRGDIAKFFSNLGYVKKLLGQEAKRVIDEMCEDSWRWQSQNFNGYES